MAKQVLAVALYMAVITPMYSCKDVREAVALHGLAAVEAWAEQHNVPQAMRARARRCLVPSRPAGIGSGKD